MFRIQKNRHLRIANYLIHQERFVTSEELAEVTDLSPRTIKSEMSFIGELLRENGAELIAKKSDGYSFRVLDPFQFESFKSRLSILFFYYDNLWDLNSYLKIVHIIRTLLAANGPVCVELLANEMGTTRTGLKHELSLARKICQDYNLHMRSSNGCVSLDPDEKWMRLCSIAVFGITYHQFEKRLPEEQFMELFACNEKQFYKMRDALLNVLIKHHVHLPDNRTQDFARYLVLACNRIYMGKNVELSNEERTEAMELMLYPAAEEIATILEEVFATTLSCNEICVLAEYMSCYSDLVVEDVTPERIGLAYEKAMQTNEILEDYLANRWAMPVQESTKNCYLPLCATFAIRDRFGFLSNKDLLLSSAKTKISASPMALNVADDIQSCLYEIFGTYGGALDFYDCAQLSYNRLHDIEYEQKKLRIAVVSSYGRMSGEKLAEYLLKYFGPFIESISSYELYELRNISPSEIDAVIGDYPASIYNYSIPLINIEHTEGITRVSAIWRKLFYRTNQISEVAQKISDVLTIEKDVVISSIDEACSEFAQTYGGNLERAKRAAAHTENYSAEFICTPGPTPCKIFNLNVQTLKNEIVVIRQLKNPIVLKCGNKISVLVFIALDYANDPALLRGMTSLLEVFQRCGFTFDHIIALNEDERKDYIEGLLMNEVRML